MARPDGDGRAAPGVSHYLTPEGARKLTAELQHLLYKERPKTVEDVAVAAAHGDRSENAEYKYGKKRLREIDGRIRFLQKRLEGAVVVDPDKQQGDAVFFGATVEVEYEDGTRRRYQLVGEDESDPDRGRVSYTSPIGRALLKKKVGDVVSLRRPAGDVELEIVGITWGAEAPQPR
ncbi:MAG: transcription elongation factor GreB [Myxococcales bacterium]|nr:transcription elongation factor GreB [Myxococcales bacterium]